ncbi:mitosis inhibitor protein kinase swe1 [Glugoides intestinalis]
MKIPATFHPPPTPVKKKSSISSLAIPMVKTCRLLAEGSFYRIYYTTDNTVLRIAKRKADGIDEVHILKLLNGHPYINKMIRWWIEDNYLFFEMEPCDFNLKEGSEQIENFFSDKNRKTIRRNKHLKRMKKPGFGNNERSSGMKIANQQSVGIKTKSDEYVSDGKAFLPLSSIFPNNEGMIDGSNTLIDPFSDNTIALSTSFICEEETSDLEESDLEEGINPAESNVEELEIPFWVNLLMYQISSALSYIHMRRIVHMDIKPDNILIKISNDSLTFQLCDFNISRLEEGPFILDGDKVYMAPEILRNKCFFNSDVYSLGLVYLELVNRTALPHAGHQYRRLRRNDFKGWSIDEIGRRMLEKDPSIRCSAKEVEAYFKKFVSF